MRKHTFLGGARDRRPGRRLRRRRRHAEADGPTPRPPTASTDGRRRCQPRRHSDRQRRQRGAGSERRPPRRRPATAGDDRRPAIGRADLDRRGRGHVTVLNWPGYVESGRQPALTGSRRSRRRRAARSSSRPFGTSDAAFQLFTTNPDQFDVISARATPACASSAPATSSRSMSI